MINLELAKIEKMLRMINRNNNVTLNNIADIKIEKFENEAIITMTSESNVSKTFTVLRKNFEDKYSLKWEG